MEQGRVRAAAAAAQQSHGWALEAALEFNCLQEYSFWVVELLRGAEWYNNALGCLSPGGEKKRGKVQRNFPKVEGTTCYQDKNSYQRLCIPVTTHLSKFNWAERILKDTVSSIKGLEMLQFSLFARRYFIKIAVNSNLFKQRRGSSCHQLKRMLAFNSVFEECFRYWFLPHTQQKFCFLCSSGAQSRKQQHFPESPESLNRSFLTPCSLIRSSQYFSSSCSKPKYLAILNYSKKSEPSLCSWVSLRALSGLQ